MTRTAETAPKPSSRHVSVRLLHRDPRYVASIGMFSGQPGAAILDVARDPRYVGAIHFGDDRLRRQRVAPTIMNDGGQHRRTMSTIGEEEDVESDSLVTDSILQMTSLTSGERPPTKDAAQEEAVAVTPRKSEDMDAVIRELAQAVAKSRNVSTLTKAVGGRGGFLRRSARALRRSFGKGLTGKASSSSTNAKFRGPEGMRELWEKSGMRTNGRKLITDSSEVSK